MYGWIIAGIATVLLVAVLVIAYVCFRMAFYVPTRKPVPADFIDVPDGEPYEPYREDMERWARETKAMPYEAVTVTSFDGLTLRGKYYEYAPDAPIELMVHGYRGNAERDLCGGVQRCFTLGHSALIVNQRASADSDGHVITFGVREYRDVLTWVAFMLNHFGKDVNIILTGISMGAATVMMTADQPLPPNVKGILADCGFTSPKAIIQKVIRQLGLPVTLAYPFVRLGGLLYGGFDIESRAAVDVLKNSRVPVIFFHGEADGYVPCEMSRENHEVCSSRKRLVTVPDADHGLAYICDPDGYRQAVKEFFDEPCA